MKTITVKIASLLMLVCVLSSQAQARVDPLSIYVRTAYPPTVETVEDAANYILAATGYFFISEYPAPLDAKRIGNSRVPPMAKIHRTMPIIDALQLLVGQEYYIVVDRNNRLISFTQQP